MAGKVGELKRPGSRKKRHCLALAEASAWHQTNILSKRNVESVPKTGKVSKQCSGTNRNLTLSVEALRFTKEIILISIFIEGFLT